LPSIQREGKKIAKARTMKFPKSTLAKRLGLARSTLYYKSKKKEADEKARTLIEEVMIGNPAYGHKRIAMELAWNKKKVLRLMKKFSLKPKLCRGKRWQKKADTGLEPASYCNLVSNWCPIEPNVVWFADFTYLKIRDSFLYLATVIDGYTKEVLGFAISKRHNRQLVKTATLEAIACRKKLSTYFHTDQGSEYQSEEHLKLLESMGVLVSMSDKSSPWQNGYQESFYSQFKLELGNLNHLSEGEIVERIYQQIYYYNHLRIHTTLKMPPRKYYLNHMNKSV
jgi:transposase InsO family protein